MVVGIVKLWVGDGVNYDERAVWVSVAIEVEETNVRNLARY